MRQTRIEFPVEGDAVDGVMCGPNRMAPPHPGVVVCHPHPLLGGTMDSPVVIGICMALAERNIFSMRFDFRRTTTDAVGLAESAVRDTATAFEVIRQWDMVNPARVALAGYSFGASTILRAASDLDAARGFAFVAPAVSAVEESILMHDSRPQLFVAGERDTLARADSLRDAVAKYPPPVQFETFEAADHSFAGVLPTVANRVAEFLAGILL